MSTTTTPQPASVDSFSHEPSEATKRWLAEMKELETLYPDYDDAERKADYGWIYKQTHTADNDWPYWNKVVAVYKRQIVATGPDGYQLMVDMARKYQVNPWQIVTTYLGDARECLL
jgi:hypothetical protein